MYILLPVWQTHVPQCGLVANVFWTLFLARLFYQYSKKHSIVLFVIHSCHAGEKGLEIHLIS